MSKKRSTSCFTCETGSGAAKARNKRLGLENPSLFKVPNDPILLSKWQDAIPRAKRMLTSSDAVCERHFLSNEIERAFETNMPDGTVVLINRLRPKLRENAIPSVFWSSHASSRSSQLKRECSVNTDSIADSAPTQLSKENGTLCQLGSANASYSGTSLQSFICKEEPQELHSEIIIKEETETHFDFDILKSNDMQLPSAYWSQAYVGNLQAVLFTKWNELYMAIKKVVVDSNLKVKVLFGQVEIKNEEIPDVIQNRAELTAILKKVDNLIVCSGISVSSMSPTCTGIGDKRSPYRKVAISSKCLSCRKVFREQSHIKRARMT